MMADVPKASVVITNPTHYAVALRYERKSGSDAGQGASGAPRVVAKGTDRVAVRIREIAREAGVPVHEDAPLARALHAQCEIGDEIPTSLYQAVAGVLAFLYRRGKGSGSPAPRPSVQPPAFMTRTAVHE
jgi:flagellar biosynthetic protein FlhB